MQEFPHHYRVAADAEASGTVLLSSDGAPNLLSAPPIEFGGPDDQ